MPDQLGFGSPEWETLRIQSWHYRAVGVGVHEGSPGRPLSARGAAAVHNVDW
jgi:hypothetical protein